MLSKRIVTDHRFKALYLCALLLTLLYGSGSAAQTKSTIIFQGPLGNSGSQKSGGNLQLGEEQKLMLEASNKFVRMDYQAAEALYTRVLQMNSRNVSAYVQRGVIRREMRDYEGMRSDARMALTLINNSLRQKSDANLYYERSLIYRLLRQFDAAEQDLRMAMRLNRSANWENDFKAIALERKMAQ